MLRGRDQRTQWKWLRCEKGGEKHKAEGSFGAYPAEPDEDKVTQRTEWPCGRLRCQQKTTAHRGSVLVTVLVVAVVVGVRPLSWPGRGARRIQWIRNVMRGKFSQLLFSFKHRVAVLPAPPPLLALVAPGQFDAREQPVSARMVAYIKEGEW